MRKSALLVFGWILVLWIPGTGVLGADLTLSTGGRVTVELVSSNAVFHNTLSIVSPAVAIAQAPDGTALTGCSIESSGFGGLELVSEKISQHGCRVELDADPATAGTQPFASGAILRFNLCAQTNTTPACEHVWSSEPTLNSDSKNHVATTTLHGGNYNLLAWEDRDGLGDGDFDDLVAVVRVAQDTDGDGLWDDWEQSGIDADGDGTIDLVLPGANHRHADIYLEIDFMDCAASGGDCAATDTHSHEPLAAAVADVVQAFDDAPVTNPDGVDGITLHVDVDDALPHQDTLNMGCFTGAVGFDTIKDDPLYFGRGNPRRFAYHYVMFTHQQVAGSTSSGCGEVPGNDLMVSLGAWNYACQGGPNAGRLCPAAVGGLNCPSGTCVALGDVDGDGNDDHDVGTVRQQAATLMHELGHNLNLRHGGGDCTNYKPNYLSIMNYWFQFSGILPGGGLDYSRVALPDLDERNVGGTGQLDETVGIQDGTDDTRFVCSDWSARTEAGTGPIDWNCDNDGGVDTAVSENVNGDCIDTVVVNCGSCETGEAIRLGVLAGYVDWDNLKYDFQNTGNFEDGVHVDLDIPDMEYPLYRVLVNAPPVCDADGPYVAECQGTTTSVVLDGSGSSDPDADPLTYAWSSDCPGGGFGSSLGVSPVLSVDSSTVPVDCGVTLTATDAAGNSDGCSSSVRVADSQAPVLTCAVDVDVECDESAQPDNAGSTSVTDVCDPDPSILFDDAVSPGACPEESVIARTWTTVDASGNTDSCVQTVNVVDTTGPVIACNTPTTIVPPDAPVSFTATASDNCDALPSVEITAYDCFAFTRNGRRIDKRESCVVQVDGATITVLDSGGVGDNVSWTVRAQDNCGNVTPVTCGLTVVRPSLRLGGK